jgi:glycosyltransferase involved in cell wall biosynthesis
VLASKCHAEVARSATKLCFVVESSTDVRLVEGLAERFELTVLARRIVGGVEVSQPPSLPVSFTVGPASRSGFARFVWQSLARSHDEIDVLLVQGYGAAALAVNMAARLRRKPAIMLVCSPVELYYRCRRANPQEGLPYRGYELAALKMLARMNGALGRRYVTLSEHLARVVSRHAGNTPVEVIPLYGVDTARFRPTSESKSMLRERAGLPVEEPLLFFSSRVAPEKDSETLLNALRLVADNGVHVRLLHRSGGYQQLQKLAHRLGVGDRVIARDAVHPHERLPLDYQACDLCVQASREEGLGFSALEALACRVPVVAAATGGLKETIRDGETGWTYPVGDAPALAACIEAAIADPAEARRRAAAGRAMVEARYERRAVFDRFAIVVDSMLNSARNGACEAAGPPS